MKLNTELKILNGKSLQFYFLVAGALSFKRSPGKKLYFTAVRNSMSQFIHSLKMEWLVC